MSRANREMPVQVVDLSTDRHLAGASTTCTRRQLRTAWEILDQPELPLNVAELVPFTHPLVFLTLAAHPALPRQARDALLGLAQEGPAALDVFSRKYSSQMRVDRHAWARAVIALAGSHSDRQKLAMAGFLNALTLEIPDADPGASVVADLLDWLVRPSLASAAALPTTRAACVASLGLAVAEWVSDPLICGLEAAGDPLTVLRRRRAVKITRGGGGDRDVLEGWQAVRALGIALENDPATDAELAVLAGLAADFRGTVTELRQLARDLTTAPSL